MYLLPNPNPLVLRPDIDEDLEELESTDEDELVVVTPSPSASLNTPRAPPIVVVSSASLILNRGGPGGNPIRTLDLF